MKEIRPPARQSLSSKEIEILDHALALLVETGDAGLTLRKLADKAGMRLSNVQYYFKSRDDVLTSMVARYFEACLSTLRQLMQSSEAQTPRARLSFLIQSGLIHGQEISDMCRAFREIWAISSRNTVIDQCLMAYYRAFADVVADFACQENMDSKCRAQLASLLVPYFEGYSVTARALPLQIDATTNMLTEMALAICAPKSA